LNETLKQFLLEIGRVVVLAVIPVILTYVQVLDASWAVVLTVVLRGLDRAIHETVNKKAITRF